MPQTPERSIDSFIAWRKAEQFLRAPDQIPCTQTEEAQGKWRKV